MSRHSGLDGFVLADGRVQWLERFSVVSKLVLRRHWQETLEATDYAHFGPDEGAELLTTMEWVVEAFSRCLREQRRLNDEELARLRALGAQRAQQGIQLEALRDSFRRGVEKCSAEFTRIAFESAGPRIGQTLTDMILHELIPLVAAAEDALTTGYRAGRRLAGAQQLGLTGQELRVLGLLPGLTNQQIAKRLGRAEQTIKSQVASILRKLGACDRAHAVAIGMSHGLIAERLPAGDDRLPA